MRTLLAALVLTALAPAAAAQQAVGVPMPESYRDTQLKMLGLQRSMLLAMADSMPESLYRDRVTPPQRDFAQQLHHAAAAMTMLTTRFMGAAAPTLPDTAVALNSRAGLAGFVNAVYDHAAEVLRSQSTEERATIVRFFRSDIPKWQIWDELHQHTVWTAGQVVANFRKHGMAPPGFGFF